MSSPKKPDPIEKLDTLVHEAPQFNADDEAVVRKMIQTYRGWLALGSIGKVLIYCLAAITTLAVASGHLKTALKNWLL